VFSIIFSARLLNGEFSQVKCLLLAICYLVKCSSKQTLATFYFYICLLLCLQSSINILKQNPRGKISEHEHERENLPQI